MLFLDTWLEYGKCEFEHIKGLVINGVYFIIEFTKEVTKVALRKRILVFLTLPGPGGSF